MGYVADFVLLSRDPLEDIRNMRLCSNIDKAVVVGVCDFSQKR